MTKHSLSLMILLLLIAPVLAQSDDADNIFCTSPFATQADVDENMQTIVQVNDAAFTAETFAERMRFEHAYNGIQYRIRLSQLTQQAEALSLPVQSLIDQDTFFDQLVSESMNSNLLALRVLDDISQEAVVWDYATQADMIITRADFDRVRLDFFDVPDIETADASGIIETFYGQMLTYGSSFETTDAFFCRLALYDLVRTDLFGDGRTATFVNADHILVSSEAIANDILTLLEDGNDFATIATQLSLDTGSSAEGGALGWQAAALYVAPFAEATLTGEVGTILPIVETQFGWHVIRLNGREDRPVEDETLQETILSTQFSQWRQSTLSDYTVNISEDWQSAVPELIDNGVQSSE